MLRTPRWVLLAATLLLGAALAGCADDVGSPQESTEDMGDPTPDPTPREVGDEAMCLDEDERNGTYGPEEEGDDDACEDHEGLEDEKNEVYPEGNETDAGALNGTTLIDPATEVMI